MHIFENVGIFELVYAFIQHTITWRLSHLFESTSLPVSFFYKIRPLSSLPVKSKILNIFNIQVGGPIDFEMTDIKLDVIFANQGSNSRSGPMCRRKEYSLLIQ